MERFGMDSKKIMDIYSFLCKKKGEGVSVGVLMEKFSCRKNEISRFLGLLKNFNDNILFYYYSPREEEFIDRLNDIGEDTIIEIHDDFQGLKLKINLDDSLRIYEVLEEIYEKKREWLKTLAAIGDRRVNSFTYILKGGNKSNYSQKSRVKRQLLIQSILRGEYIEIFLKGGQFRIKGIIPVGMYYHNFREKTLLVADTGNKYNEFIVEEITSVKKTGENRDVSFDLVDYLNDMRNTMLVLLVFDEANVIEKVRRAFSGYTIKEETWEQGVIFKIMVENPFFYKPFIDSLGKSVIVREPKELKETIIEEARELLVKYALKKTTI
jgi:hypothetical protein